MPNDVYSSEYVYKTQFWLKCKKILGLPNAVRVVMLNWPENRIMLRRPERRFGAEWSRCSPWANERTRWPHHEPGAKDGSTTRWRHALTHTHAGTTQLPRRTFFICAATWILCTPLFTLPKAETRRSRWFMFDMFWVDTYVLCLITVCQIFLKCLVQVYRNYL